MRSPRVGSGTVLLAFSSTNPVPGVMIITHTRTNKPGERNNSARVSFQPLIAAMFYLTIQIPARGTHIIT